MYKCKPKDERIKDPNNKSCATTDGQDCILPFKYKGKTYNKCTDVDSSNRQSWCAFEVDGTGETVAGKWGDCNAECPKTGQISNKNLSLFSYFSDVSFFRLHCNI